uniref:Retrovirus-related Pol polyprotein from transposon TNT 1-94 n=1 Tax=Tanacetum cinerariifolium TaxID=118510 RepID=A0A6L2KU60_TANCI|nr:retrovirus-related Pol polyprotein from transposon TNT 1-94 [Tanacetum cinerariifolium]
MLKIDVEPLALKLLNNRTVHSNYLRQTQEQAAILMEVVEQGKSQNPLNNSLDHACKYTKRIQELLLLIRQTCPSINGSSGVKPSTSASGSQPSGNTKKDKIHRPPRSTQKNKVEAHPKTAKSSLKNKNCVVKPKGTASVHHSKINTNSKLICIKSNACMLSDNHDLCVLNDVNARVKSKYVKKNSKRKFWKPAGKQNGVVERRNRTLIEAACTMLIYAKALLFLWAEAVATACYTQNRSIIRLCHGKTPYELLHNKPPDLSFLHVFGTLCYPTNDSEYLGKLQPKADIGIFIGYAPTKKAFQIYNRRTRQIIETIHVDLDELTVMASKHSSLGPALHEMTPATISLGLVPNPPPSTPFVPPSRTDWDMLFQPLFDELLNPPPSVY